MFADFFCKEIFSSIKLKLMKFLIGINLIKMSTGEIVFCYGIYTYKLCINKIYSNIKFSKV